MIISAISVSSNQPCEPVAVVLEGVDLRGKPKEVSITLLFDGTAVDLSKHGLINVVRSRKDAPEAHVLTGWI